MRKTERREERRDTESRARSKGRKVGDEGNRGCIPNVDGSNVRGPCLDEEGFLRTLDIPELDTIQHIVGSKKE